MKQNQKLLFALIFTFSVSLMLIGFGYAQEDRSEAVHLMTTHVHTHPSQGEVRDVEGAAATFMTSEAGAAFTLRTSELQAGHVYTIWWVVINNPAACETSPCTVTDVIGNRDAVQSDVTLADSGIMDDEEQMVFASFLPAGEMAEGWLGNGFTNPMGAEIHLVINDHGVLIPDMAANMLDTYRGGCTDESLPPPFPETATSDGELGPNTCRLIQATTLIQGS